MSSLTQDLRAVVTGPVIDHTDARYDALRAIFPGGVDRRPALIVRPKSAQDVGATIARVKRAGVPLAIRSGGHTIHCTNDGGVVLDLREMTAVEVDIDGGTAWAETGLTAAAYSKAVGAHGFATGFGDTGSVGIGGITLGGGVGYLVRKYGLTIDNLIAADVVTADGLARRVDASSDPDLLWALRGGGGNFGVATRFQFKLQPVPQVVGGMLVLPGSPEVIDGFIKAAEAAPDELTTIANVMTAPPMPFLAPEHHGKIVLLAFMCYAGDAAAGDRALAPFRSLATPLADLVKPIPYAEMFPPDDESYHPTAVGRTLFIDRFDRDIATTIVRHLEDSDAPLRVAQLRVLGGAMARIAPDATAFAHRQRRMMVNVAAFYSGDADRPLKLSWVERFAAALDQGVPGAYVNFLNNEGRERVRTAYPGPTWERLRAIKQRVDPDNFFRSNENIA